LGTAYAKGEYGDKREERKEVDREREAERMDGPLGPLALAFIAGTVVAVLMSRLC
jgi:hypothetical protein